MNEEESMSNMFLNLESNFSELRDIPTLSAVVYGRMVQNETIVKFADPRSREFQAAADGLIYLYEHCVRDRMKDYPTENTNTKEEEIKRIIELLKKKYGKDKIKPNPDNGIEEGPPLPGSN